MRGPYARIISEVNRKYSARDGSLRSFAIPSAPKKIAALNAAEARIEMKRDVLRTALACVLSSDTYFVTDWGNPVVRKRLNTVAIDIATEYIPYMDGPKNLPIPMCTI